MNSNNEIGKFSYQNMKLGQSRVCTLYMYDSILICHVFFSPFFGNTKVILHFFGIMNFSCYFYPTFMYAHKCEMPIEPHLVLKHISFIITPKTLIF